MKELSLHVLDVARNSLSAGCALLEVTAEQTGSLLTLRFADDGCGMDVDLLASVLDPFTTTRTTRGVGLGLSLLRLTCEQTGGGVTVESAPGAGTVVTAVLHTAHIDAPPMGDLGSAAALLVQDAGAARIRLVRRLDERSYTFDTDEIRAILGPDVPLSDPAVTLWIADYLREQEALLSPETTSNP